MRRTLLLAAEVAAALLLAALPRGAGAQAPVFAGEVRTASTTFQLGGRDGRTWLVHVSLDELRPVGGAVSRTLGVSLRPCAVSHGRTRCGAEQRYRTSVADGAVAADLRSAYVRTRVLGASLDLSWSVDVGHSASVAAVSDGEVAVRHAYQGGAGPVRGIVLGPRCSADGEVGGGYVVRLAGPPPRPGGVPPAALPAALTPAHGWVPACV
jgi:hypothetical protein